MKKALKWFLIVLAGLLAAVLVALSIILTPRFLTKTANKLAADYVDGTATVGRLDISLLKNWPAVRVDIDSLVVTYPHDRFSSFDSLTVLNPQFTKEYASELGLLDAGRGETADTLAAIGHLSAEADIPAFLFKKIIRIPEVSISRLKAFAHIYDDSTANWSIIRLPESSDTTSKPLPHIEAEEISISGIEDIVLTSPEDTLFAGASFSTFDLDGKFSIDGGVIKTAARLLLDADAHFCNASLGSIDAPLTLETDAGLETDTVETAVNARKFTANVASIPLEASGELRLTPDSTYVNASAAVENCPAGQLLKDYGRFLPPVVDGLETDAAVTMRAEADGWFGSASGILPLISAEVIVPDSHIAYEGLVDDGVFDLTLKASTDEAGILTADLEDLCFDIQGVSLNMSGKGTDLLGQDPKFGVKAFACTEFADLVKYLPPETGISASGDVDFEVEGDVSLSQLNLRNIHQSDLKGHIFSDGFRFSIPGDTLYAYASHPDIHLSTEGHRISVDAGIDSVRFIAGASTYIMGTSFGLKAGNNGRLVSESGKIQPVTADLSLASFNMRGTDSLTLGVRNSSNRLVLGSVAADGTVRSNVSVKSTNKMAFMRSGANRVTLADPDISASLHKREPRTSRRGQGGRLLSAPDRARLDSAFRMRGRGDSTSRLERALPDYLKEVDFRKKDLSIDIGEGLTSLFRKWAPEAEVGFSLGTVSTPVLPLRNSITSFDAKFNGDKLELANFLISSGTSTVGFRGTVTGLEPMLLGRHNPTLNAIVTLHSRMLNLNELLAALQAGSEFGTAADSDQEEYVIEGLENAEEKLDFSAIIIPSNVNANLTVDIDSVRYSKIAVGGFSSRIRMRERCIQITNTSASSEFGSVNVDGFYSTVAKDDITAGFNLKLSSITADRIITLIPAVDSLVPMLKSFKGNLNCEVAATSRLDTNMNILIPTVSGAVKLNGSGLELSDTGDLRRIARLLQFKDAKVGHIDDMSVSGIVADNQLEVFPFILGVDRYTLGLSGLQGFDQHFSYHISVIKSPLPFKFGVNLKGSFDNWSFTLGKPKYKSTSIPLFSPQVDTLQVNLASSIKNIFRKGVDAAVREYAQERQRVNARREEFGLFEDNEDEELTAEERDQLDAYMLDIECEVESEAIERELDEFLGEDMMSGILAELLGEL